MASNNNAYYVHSYQYLLAHLNKHHKEYNGRIQRDAFVFFCLIFDEIQMET